MADKCRTSYTHTVDYGDVIRGITAAIAPKRIVEIGVLDGFSLEAFRSAAPTATINAYDIFAEFNGNHADQAALACKFSAHENVSIQYGDFYRLHEQVAPADIIHIDVANDGDVFEFAIKHYLPLLAPGGVMLLEGGSPERDKVPWMNEYGKRPINPVVSSLGLQVIGTHPSLTVVRGDL